MMIIRSVLCLLVCLSVNLRATSAETVDFSRWQSDIDGWKDDIQRFEERDRTEKDPPNAILFVGSSSIRRWETIRQDMAPYSVIQRGYGGAKFSDLAYYVDRIVLPHQFRALVIFVGNDIAGKEEDKTAEEIVQFFQHTVQVVRQQRPQVPIFCIDVRPSIARWKVWPETVAANRALEAACESDPNLHFLKTADLLLNEAGQPRSDLLDEDDLHLNAAGYRVWAKRIKQVLQSVLGATKD